MCPRGIPGGIPGRIPDCMTDWTRRAIKQSAVSDALAVHCCASQMEFYMCAGRTSGEWQDSDWSMALGRTAMTAWYISRADPHVELARRPVNCQYGTSRATWPDDDTTWCTLSNVQLMYSLTLRDLRTYFSATKHHRDSLAYLYVKRRPDVHVCQKSFDTQSQSLMFQTA